MNGKVAKKHRRAADKVALAWLKTLVSEEEAKVYTIKNFKGYLTKTTHIMTEGQYTIMPHSYRWFTRTVKKFGVDKLEQRINR